MKDKYTLGNYLYNGLNVETLEKIFEVLDYQLKQLHNKNKYVQNITFSTIVFDDEEGYFTFKNEYIQRMPKEYDSIIFVNKNIDNLIKLFIGAYTYQVTLEQNQQTNIEWFDFSTISKKNPTYVSDHYNYLKTLIPNIDRYETYYDNAILNNEYEYFNDYKKNQHKNSNKSSSMQMVYATKAGKALTDKEEKSNAAYAQILMYPIIIACFIMLIAVFYMIYLFT